ncbi:MAG: hypothetical protein RLZZ511_1846 [Cyanobacteriota bacterium]|jgi:uncharacterized RDD family membrane protein YckC
MQLFNRITVKTPESVELEFNLAGIGNRAFALFIDNLLVWGIFIVVAYLTAAGLSGLEAIGVEPSNAFNQWLGAIAILFSFFWFIGYFIVFETIWQGQTPGKRLVKIRVIADDGRPLQIYQATLRAVLRPLDDWLFLGFFFVLFGQQEKRLGDWVGSTIVIQAEQPTVGSAQMPFSGKAQNVADRVTLATNVGDLRPNDFAILKEFLQRRQTLEQSARDRLSQDLVAQITDRLDLHSLEFVEPAEVVLEGIYLAYEQLG